MRHNLSLASAIFVLFAAVMLLVACESKPQAAQPKVVTIEIRDFKYVPDPVTVHEGDTVEWKNEDNELHTATADGQAQKPAFDSGSISKGATWRYVAGTKGTYNYTCTYHPKMHGQLIVQ